MQRLTRRLVVCGVLGLFAACAGDPTNNTGTPTRIVLSPGVVFVPQGDSQPVIASVVDEDGQALQADFTASNVGSGIQVVLDPTFLPVSSSNPIRRSARFFVKGIDLAATTFDINALGLTATVNVTSVPSQFTGTFSNTAPALGDTITLTAAPGTSFTDSTVLTFSGQPAFVISQDATTIVFLPPPNVPGIPAGLTNVAVASNPNLVFTLVTAESFTTDSIRDAGSNLTPTTPALGGTVTLVLPPELRVLPESLPAFRVAGDTVAPLNLTISADSSTITFVPAPNADTTVEVHGLIARRLPQFPLTVATTARLTTPVVTTVPSTVSNVAPAGGAAVTLTSTDAGFTFTSATQVLIGTDTALTQSTTSSSVTFIPKPGSTGPITVTPVTVGGVFPLTLPSTVASLTAGTTVPAIAGTGAPGSAPTITLPSTGEVRGIVDAGTFGYAGCGDIGVDCQIYKFILAADASVNVMGNWEGTSDVGIYFLASDGTTAAGDGACDANGNGATAQPETCTEELTAGTYFMAVVPFGAFYSPAEANPTWVQVRMSQTPAGP